MKRAIFLWGLVLGIAAVLTAACSSSDSAPASSAGGHAGSGSGGAGGAPQGGSAGSTGQAGTQGGSAGSTGQGGAAGSSGQGGSAGSTGQGGTAGSSGACSPEPNHDGKITYYAATGAGNCSFDPSPQDLMVGAMNHAQYAASAVCGACALIHGPDGDVTVRIVDQCPECQVGHIDLSHEAFAKVADPALGVVNVTWQYVPCPVQGNVVYHFKDGSNQWWTAVQVRNHRYAIASFEYLGSDNAFHAVDKVDYNFFLKADGMGPGPYTFRITDVHGHVLQDSGIVGSDNIPVPGLDVPGSGQFPSCN